MSAVEMMEPREDGDFDIIRINMDLDGKETSREHVRIVPYEDREFPNGRPTDEQASVINTYTRQEKLLESDGTQLVDAFANNTRKKAEWAYYRQQIRDMDKQPNWPHIEDDEWPIKPT